MKPFAEDHFEREKMKDNPVHITCNDLDLQDSRVLCRGRQSLVHLQGKGPDCEDLGLCFYQDPFCDVCLLQAKGHPEEKQGLWRGTWGKLSPR